MKNGRYLEPRLDPCFDWSLDLGGWRVENYQNRGQTGFRYKPQNIGLSEFLKKKLVSQPSFFQMLVLGKEKTICHGTFRLSCCGKLGKAMQIDVWSLKI